MKHPNFKVSTFNLGIIKDRGPKCVCWPKSTHELSEHGMGFLPSSWIPSQSLTSSFLWQQGGCPYSSAHHKTVWLLGMCSWHFPTLEWTQWPVSSFENPFFNTPENQSNCDQTIINRASHPGSLPTRAWTLDLAKDRAPGQTGMACTCRNKDSELHALSTA